MLLKVYAYPAAYSWMRTKVGLLDSIEELSKVIKEFSPNEVIEVVGDDFKVIRNSSGEVTSEGSSSIDRLSVAKALKRIVRKKLVC